MPTPERRKEIDNIIEHLVQENYVLSKPAFDIVKFLKDKESFAIGTSPMDDDTTGLLLVDDENFIENTETHKLIAINSELLNEENFIQRRRFIIAHEYAHYILHKKDKMQFAHRDTSKRETAAEKEADYFARCLLMPKDLVDILLGIDFVKDVSFKDKVAIVARMFNVTKKKAEQRLREDFNYG